MFAAQGVSIFLSQIRLFETDVTFGAANPSKIKLASSEIPVIKCTAFQNVDRGCLL